MQKNSLVERPSRLRIGLDDNELLFDLDEFCSEVQRTYLDQLVYLGLHGSYSKGCATPYSDVDFTLVLKAITPEALRKLKNILTDRPKASVYLLSEVDLCVRPASNNLQFFYGQQPLCGVYFYTRV